MPRGIPNAKTVSTDAAGPAVHIPSKSSTVTVACKIPHGIVMQLAVKTTYFEDTPSGSRERTRYDKAGERVFIRGNSRPVNPPAGFPDPGPIAFGYGLTPDVDAEFFAEWMRQNAKAPMVANGLIFGMPTLSGINGQAREFEGKRSGLEPLQIDNDPRVPKPTRNEVHQIAKADLTQ